MTRASRRGRTREHFEGPGQPGIQGAWGAHAHGEQGGEGENQGIDVVVHKKVPDAACEGPPRPGVPPAPRAIAAQSNLASPNRLSRPVSNPAPSFSSSPSPLLIAPALPPPLRPAPISLFYSNPTPRTVVLHHSFTLAHELWPPTTHTISQAAHSRRLMPNK